LLILTDFDLHDRPARIVADVVAVHGRLSRMAA
jgi:hypothetical protein